MPEPIVPADVAKGLINMITDKATAQDRAVAYEHITQLVYTERARLVAFLASVYPSRIGPDPKDPAWFVVTVDTPVGQMCWHVSDADRLERHLFDHVTPEVPSDEPWDGHTTEDKYQRLEQLVLLNDAAPWDTHEAYFDKAEVGAVRQVLAGVRAVLDSPRAHGMRNSSDPDGEPMRMVFVKDVEDALAGQPVAMAQPGPLRWKFDGGRGAMLDLRDHIVGYYTPQGLKMPDPNVLSEAVYDVLYKANVTDNLAQVANDVVDVVMTTLRERNS